MCEAGKMDKYFFPVFLVFLFNIWKILVNNWKILFNNWKILVNNWEILSAAYRRPNSPLRWHWKDCMNICGSQTQSILVTNEYNKSYR